MAIDRYYTPRALADATGLGISACRTLIVQSPDRLCISRNPDSKKKRWAISERGFRDLVEKHRDKARMDQYEREKKKNPAKHERTRKKAVPAAIPGLTPDGKIMTSSQLKAAGLWKRA